MSKRKRKKGKKKTKNPVKNNNKREEVHSPSRRTFLKRLGLGALIVPGLYVANRLISDDRWDFLYREVTPKMWTVPGIETNLIPCGPELDLSDQSKEFKELVKTFDGKTLDFHITNNGLDPKRKALLTPTRQFYGVPEEKKFTEPFVDYIEQAIGFMKTEIKGVKDFPLKLTKFRNGENYSDDYKTRVFLGKDRYEIQRIHHVYAETPEQRTFLLARSRHIGNFGLCNVQYHENGELNWYFLFLATGKTALNTPFSEILPLTTAKVRQAHIKEVGLENGLIADETLVEGISYLLALDLANKLDIPNGIQIIEECQKKLVHGLPKYHKVPKAVEWMRANSIQDAFDLYMEDPQKFMKRIKA